MGLMEHSFLFDIILRVLITAYGANGIWNFIAYTPWGCCDDDFFKYNQFNYTFWLISSLIFLAFWTLQFQRPILVYLSLIEMVALIIIYMFLIADKRECIKKQNQKRREMEKKRMEMLRARINQKIKK